MPKNKKVSLIKQFLKKQRIVVWYQKNKSNKI